MGMWWGLLSSVICLSRCSRVLCFAIVCLNSKSSKGRIVPVLTGQVRSCRITRSSRMPSRIQKSWTMSTNWIGWLNFEEFGGDGVRFGVCTEFICTHDSFCDRNVLLTYPLEFFWIIFSTLVCAWGLFIYFVAVSHHPVEYQKIWLQILANLVLWKRKYCTQISHRFHLTEAKII